MYIDNLTIAALFIFAIASIAVIWFCMVRLCGQSSAGAGEDKPGRGEP